MAVTPMPPAVQIRDHSALGPGFIENFREGGDDSRAGRAKVADRKLRPSR